jgi:hypothetical protein
MGRSAQHEGAQQPAPPLPSPAAPQRRRHGRRDAARPARCRQRRGAGIGVVVAVLARRQPLGPHGGSAEGRGALLQRRHLELILGARRRRVRRRGGRRRGGGGRRRYAAGRRGSPGRVPQRSSLRFGSSGCGCTRPPPHRPPLPHLLEEVAARPAAQRHLRVHHAEVLARDHGVGPRAHRHLPHRQGGKGGQGGGFQ